MPNVPIREMFGAVKGLDERIDVSVLQWFGHIERMRNDKIAKRVYMGDCVGSCLVG